MGVNVNGNFYIQPQRINSGGSNVYNTLLNPSGGNVLIGTTTDASFKLDVNGTGRFSGNVTATGGTFTSGTNDNILGAGALTLLNYSAYNSSANQSITLGLGLSTAVNNNTAYRYIFGVGGDANGQTLTLLSNRRALADLTILTVNGTTGTATFVSSVTASGLISKGTTLNNNNNHRFLRADNTEMGYIGWSDENTNNSTWLFKSSNGNAIAFSPDGVNQEVIFNTDGSAFFNYPILGSRSFVFRTVSGRPINLETVALGGIHALYLRPNDSGRHLISSNYLSGGVYLPLALSSRENDADLVLTTNGNVGIGTTTPTTYSLSGTHTEIFGGSTYSFLHINTTTVKSFLASNESALLTALFTFSAHPLTLGTSNTERMRITSGGNVLIGTTTDLGYKLQISGTILQSSYTYHTANAFGNLTGATWINTGLTLPANNLGTYEVYVLGNENNQNQCLRIYYVYYNTNIGWTSLLAGNFVQPTGNSYGEVNLRMTSGGTIEVNAANSVSTGLFRISVTKQFKN
jgi:hypothetical protein